MLSKNVHWLVGKSTSIKQAEDKFVQHPSAVTFQAIILALKKEIDEYSQLACTLDNADMNIALSCMNEIEQHIVKLRAIYTS